MFQQRPPLGGPQSGYRLEYRLVVAACALTPVAGNCKAVSFIANALNESGRRRVRFRNTWLGDAMNKQPLLPRFSIRPHGNAHQRYIGESEPGELVVHLVDLPQSTIDQQQIGQGNLAVLDPRIASLECLTKRPVVVSRSDPSDVEAPILFLQRPLR